MAGVLGIEPRNGGTKNRCLTAWLHPNETRDLHPAGDSPDRKLKHHIKKRMFMQALKAPGAGAAFVRRFDGANGIKIFCKIKAVALLTAAWRRRAGFTL